ncbi:uncharacterized protein LOC120680151 isoform X1 [Panicum virgatum]|uniref:uncharacterized protein LOC120680151 isoform X1 n=1 Tax=Panicum virgatum TaxID=38727 RepID=UPI0019D67045|nr:uncharacterized protein LOC120680151 isoform X1 [Panicum virgatum]
MHSNRGPSTKPKTRREASKQHEAVPRKWEFLLVPKCEVILFASRLGLTPLFGPALLCSCFPFFKLCCAEVSSMLWHEIQDLIYTARFCIWGQQTRGGNCITCDKLVGP